MVIVLFTLAFLGPLYWMVTGGLKTTQEVVPEPAHRLPHVGPHGELLPGVGR